MSKLEGLTPKRKTILDFITRYIDEQGFAPSIDDIAKGCGVSSNSIVQYYLNVLEREGYIRRRPETYRSISLTRRPQSGIMVPLFGTIPAGQPIPVPTEETWHTVVEEMVEVPAEMLPRGVQAYALRVEGKSMIDAFVDDGDIVILEATPAAENGQMVAAWLTDRQETTLKKIYYEPNHIRLQPANESMEPIYVDPNKVHVQGRVIAVLRKYDLGVAQAKA
jgi:repressor LexA